MKTKAKNERRKAASNAYYEQRNKRRAELESIESGRLFGGGIMYDAMKRAIEQAEEAAQSLIDKQAALLSRVAVALRGPEPPQTLWGHADLPERTQEMQVRAYAQLADLRTQIEALANEMETAERGVRLQYWIISLRKIAERGGAGENGMDILDRAIDRIEEHSWTQDGPMSDEDDAAIDLLKECMEAVERELLAEKEAK